MRKQSAIWSMVLIAVFALSFPLTLSAEESGQDIWITVKETYTHRYSYSVDILFKNTTYEYKMLSLAENTETGERYVNSGVWLEQTGAESEGFRVSVLNRSDTPIHANIMFDTEAFAQCGSDVTYRSEGDATLPAVLILDGTTKAYEYSELAVFGLYPELEKMEGQKYISATVYIMASGGVRSNGEPFDPSAK